MNIETSGFHPYCSQLCTEKTAPDLYGHVDCTLINESYNKNRVMRLKLGHVQSPKL